MEVRLKPSLKATVTPLLVTTLAGIVATLIPFYTDFYPYAIELALGIASLLVLRRQGLSVSIPFFVGSLCYFNKYLALLSMVVALLEDLIIVKAVKSTEIIISGNEVVVKKDYILKRVTKTVPKSSVAEISVNQGLLERIMGISDIVIVLRNGEKIKIEGVKRELAEEALKVIRSAK